MKIFDINDSSINKILKITDFDNFFDVYIDKKNNYVFNLNETILLNAKKTSLPQYTCQHDMHWPLISYKIYGTTRLAWLIMKVNDVDASNIFIKKKAGEKVYYINSETVQSIVSELNDFSE